MIYFDNAATTKISPEVLKAMTKVYDEYFANPSSIHIKGRKAKQLIESCRSNILKIIKANNMNLIFTSGATESNNLAIKGFCKGKTGNIISIRIEHESVLEPLKELEKEGFTITYIDIDKNGLIDFNQLRNSITDDTILMTFSIVNNETGIIQEDYRKIVDFCHKHNIAVHTDAVQTFGHMEVDYSDFDMVTFTAHKIHGPRGIGALLVNKNIRLSSLISGGGQENNMRGGTESTALVYGFYLAVKNIYKDMKIPQISMIKNYILKEIKNIVPDVVVNGAIENIPHILNITIPFDGDVVVCSLSPYDIYISSGSACMNNSEDYSHVIYELTKSKEKARRSIRLSFGLNSTMEEAAAFVEVFETVLKNLAELENFHV